MLRLIKYEFRKTVHSKLIILAFTALMELLFLAGIFFSWEKGLQIGLIGLVLCATIGISYIGIESLMVFHRDLNTKQSYMLFLTPNNSYQILGAKVVENGISILLAGVFFAALASLDWTTAVLRLGGLRELLTLLKQMSFSLKTEFFLSPDLLLMSFFSMLASWLMTIVTGYFAILLSASILAGKKFSGFVSFLFFLLLFWGSAMLLNLIPGDGEAYIWLCILATLAITALMYVISGWVMERKLSV